MRYKKEKKYRYERKPFTPGKSSSKHGQKKNHYLGVAYFV